MPKKQAIQNLHVVVISLCFFPSFLKYLFNWLVKLRFNLMLILVNIKKHSMVVFEGHSSSNCICFIKCMIGAENE